MRKKLVMTLLIGTILLAVTACGAKKNSDGTTDGTTEIIQEDPKVEEGTAGETTLEDDTKDPVVEEELPEDYKVPDDYVEGHEDLTEEEQQAILDAEK